MRGIRIATATLAGVIACSGAAAEDFFTLRAGGTFDFKFNTFLPPNDGFEVGDTWELVLSYDVDMPSTGTNPNAQSFKDALCYLGLTITKADGTKMVKYVNFMDQMDFDDECDLIVTTDPCTCSDESEVVIDFSSVLGFGFNFIVSDPMGMTLPLLELPTSQAELDGLAGGVTFDFFAPGVGGSTARLVSVGAEFLTVEEGKVPAPATAALMGLGGLIAARRRR